MQTRNAARRTSIVDSFHEPTLRAQVLVDAIQRGHLFFFLTVRLNLLPQRPHFDVPFIACPRGFGPPGTFRSPRSGERKNLPASPFTTEEDRLSFAQLHARWKRRPINSHRDGSLFFRDGWLFFHFWQNK